MNNLNQNVSPNAEKRLYTREKHVKSWDSSKATSQDLAATSGAHDTEQSTL